MKKIITLTGMSASGKSTLEKEMIKEPYGYKSLVTCTTRIPRPGEVDGVDYHYKTVEEFKSLIEQNKLIEYVEFNGNYYGATFKSIDDLNDNASAVIVIEPEGAKRIKDYCLEAGYECVTVFMDTSWERCVNRVFDRLRTLNELGSVTPLMIDEYVSRFYGMISKESSWADEIEYNIFINGDKYENDMKTMIDMIEKNESDPHKHIETPNISRKVIKQLIVKNLDKKSFVMSNKIKSNFSSESNLEL